MGVIEDFHKEIEGSWTILFSHPADFTPVCTTEIGKLAISYDELASLGCKIYTLSANSLGDHQTWLNDVVAHCEASCIYLARALLPCLSLAADAHPLPLVP